MPTPISRKRHVDPDREYAPARQGIMPGRGRTAEISSAAWNKFQDYKEGWQMPTLFVRRGVEPEVVDVPSVPQLIAAPEKNPIRDDVLKWLSLSSTKRPWQQWLKMVGQPERFTYAVEALWQKKQHSPVPNDMVLVVDKYSAGGKVRKYMLAVFPMTETAVT